MVTRNNCIRLQSSPGEILCHLLEIGIHDHATVVHAPSGSLANARHKGNRDKEMRNEIIHRAKSVWAGSHSPVLNRGCSEEDFQGFRDTWGQSFPEDMREFHREINGFDQWNGPQDSNGFNLWPIDKIEEIRSFAGGGFFNIDDPKMYVFADYLDFSWGYAFVPTPRYATTPVVMIGTADGTRPVIAASFMDFVEMLLRDDVGLYPA